MKRKYIFGLAALLMCSANTVSAQQVVLYRADGTQVKLHVSEFDSLSLHPDNWVDPTGQPNRVPQTFIATFEGSDRNAAPHKVHMGTTSGTDKTMLWTSEDKISSLYVSEGASKNDALTLSAGSDSKSGTFNGVTGTSPLAFISPYQYQLTVDNTDKVSKLYLPTAQKAVANGYDSKAALMMASEPTSSNQIGFRNICSYLAFTPTTNLEYVVIESNTTGTALAGAANVTYSEGEPAVDVTGGSSKVTLAGPLTAGNTYYVAVYPCTNTNGFKVTCYSTAKKYEKSISSSATFRRSYYHDCTGMIGTGTDEDIYVDLKIDYPGAHRYWGKKNVGSVTPTPIPSRVDDDNYKKVIGDYFAWGETTAYLDYYVLNGDITQKDHASWNNYLWGNGEKGLVAYSNNSEYGCEDNVSVLEDIDDAATAHWGADWSMPTKDDLDALVAQCKYEYIKSNGTVVGIVFYEKGYEPTTTDNTLDAGKNYMFLPFGGYVEGTSSTAQITGLGTAGYYWSESLNTTCPSNAYCLRFGYTKNGEDIVYTAPYVDATVSADGANRCRGRNVRPIYIGPVNP